MIVCLSLISDISSSQSFKFRHHQHQERHGYRSQQKSQSLPSTFLLYVPLDQNRNGQPVSKRTDARIHSPSEVSTVSLKFLIPDSTTLWIRIHGSSPPPAPCKPSYEVVATKNGLMELKLKECPENIIQQLLRKKYRLEKYEAKKEVAEAKGHAKANTIIGKSLLKLPKILHSA